MLTKFIVVIISCMEVISHMLVESYCTQTHTVFQLCLNKIERKNIYTSFMTLSTIQLFACLSIHASNIYQVATICQILF